MDRPRRSDCTAGQLDGEAGWWTTSGITGLPPLARVMRVGRQQQPRFQSQSLSSSQTTSRDAKPTQYIEITHPHNVNSKLAFHKVTSFHQHYSTFTLKTYHHPEHWFRQMTSPSHLHTQARVKPKKYIQPYLHKVFAWTKQNNFTLNPDKTTCTLFTADPAVFTNNRISK